MCIVWAIGFKNQCTTWQCLACSCRSYCGTCHCPPLSDIDHASYNTPKMVEWYIHTSIMVLGPLRYYWGAWFELSVSDINVPPGHVFGLVGARSMLYGVAHPCQTLSMPSITLPKWWASIFIQVAWSLDHYTTAEIHGVYLEVITWSMGLPTPVRCCPCLI